MTDYRSRLLTPPREEEDVQLYRSVWRSIIIEHGLFAALAILSFVVFGLLAIPVSGTLRLVLNIIMAISPSVFWLVFSWFSERFVPMPRSGMFTIYILAALAYGAVAEPLISDFFRISEWLPLSPALNRIVGYAICVGTVQVGLCYLITRTVIWPHALRERYDPLAYAMAASTGYILVPAIEFALNGNPNPYVVASHTLSLMATVSIPNALMSYGLAALRFDHAPAAFMPFLIALSSALVGIGIPLYLGFLNASFSPIGSSVQRHIFGLGFAIGFILAGFILIFTLFGYAERQAIRAVDDVS
jgi:hypothetical protein